VCDGSPWNCSFIRAPENARDVSAHANVLRKRFMRDGGKTFNTLGNGAIDVALREGFRRGRKDGDFRNFAAYCFSEALQIGHERGIGNAGKPVEFDEDGSRVGHLRDPFRGDETAAFDVAQSCVGDCFDEGDFGLDRNCAGFILQAVAGADLNDLHVPSPLAFCVLVWCVSIFREWRKLV